MSSTSSSTSISSSHRKHSKSVSWHVSSEESKGPATSDQDIPRSRNSLPPIRSRDRPQEDYFTVVNPLGRTTARSSISNNLDSLITNDAAPSKNTSSSNKKPTSISIPSTPNGSDSTNITASNSSNTSQPRSASPSKRYRTRTKINPAPIATNPDSEFKFPYRKHSPTLSESHTLHSHSHSYSFSSDIDDAMTLVGNLTSPLSDICGSTDFDSPYIITSRPNLQEIFICLAHKERRVLEAREHLFNAENELALFKKRWSSILNTPGNASSLSEKGEGNLFINGATNETFESTPNYRQTRKPTLTSSSPSILEESHLASISPSQISPTRITRRIITPQSAQHGLGINVVPYSEDDQENAIDACFLDDDLKDDRIVDDDYITILPSTSAIRATRRRSTIATNDNDRNIDSNIHSIRIDPTFSAPTIVRLLRNIIESIFTAIFGSFASALVEPQRKTERVYISPHEDEITLTASSNSVSSQNGVVKPRYPSITERYYRTPESSSVVSRT